MVKRRCVLIGLPLKKAYIKDEWNGQSKTRRRRATLSLWRSGRGSNITYRLNGMHAPTQEEFLKRAAQGNLIPVTRRLLADFETPLSAYHKIRGQGESFLFESVEGGEHLGRYSFVGCNPRAIMRQDGSQVVHMENGRVLGSYTVSREKGEGSVRDG